MIMFVTFSSRHPVTEAREVVFSPASPFREKGL